MVNIYSDVYNRILSLTRKTIKKHIPVASIDDFKKLSYKNRMQFLCDIISLFSPIKFIEIFDVLKVIYGNAFFDIKIEIAMLKALGIVDKYNNFYYRNVKDKGLFFSYPKIDVVKLRSIVINHYSKYSDERTEVLTNMVLN